uniref:Uncharacterized protein n=1 Tax=Setaria digitata TaxID=48799 RepID=A0A915Q1A8_9BILA
MMNVVLLSCGRNKRWKRHSITVFDQSNNLMDINNVLHCRLGIENLKRIEKLNYLHYLNQNYLWPDALCIDIVLILTNITDGNNSLHALMSQSFSQKRNSERRLPENCRDLYVIRRLAKSSDGITTGDLEILRKTFMERFTNCKEHSERIYELKSAICATNEIKICSRDLQWLTQYQYILNWCYCQIRFMSNPAERLQLFLEVKEKYRKMFEILNDVNDVDKLTSYLHWSQLCYQYAELVDRESLSWCIEAVTSAKNALLPSSRSSTLSRKTDSSGSYRSSSDSVNGNEQIEMIRSENQRRVKIATIGLIQSNVLKTENVYACSLKKRLKPIL